MLTRQPRSSRLLRVGIFRGDHQLDERLLRGRSGLTIGQDTANDIVTPSASAPRSFTLFGRSRGGGRVLRFERGMRGQVRLRDAVTVDLERVRGVEGMRDVGDGVHELELGDHARGRVLIGDLAILFHHIQPTPVTHVEMAAIRHRKLRDLSSAWLWTGLALGALILIAPLLYITHRDWPTAGTIGHLGDWEPQGTMAMFEPTLIAPEEEPPPIPEIEPEPEVVQRVAEPEPEEEELVEEDEVVPEEEVAALAGEPRALENVPEVEPEVVVQAVTDAMTDVFEELPAPGRPSELSDTPTPLNPQPPEPGEVAHAAPGDGGEPTPPGDDPTMPRERQAHQSYAQGQAMAEDLVLGLGDGDGGPDPGDFIGATAGIDALEGLDAGSAVSQLGEGGGTGLEGAGAPSDSPVGIRDGGGAGGGPGGGGGNGLVGAGPATDGVPSGGDGEGAGGERGRVRVALSDHRARVPSAANVSGDDRGAIERVFRRNRGQIERCYRRIIQRYGDAPGKLEMIINIGRDGQVIQIKTRSDEVGHGLARCVEGKIRRWKFPATGKVIPVGKRWVFGVR